MDGNKIDKAVIFDDTPEGESQRKTLLAASGSVYPELCQLSGYLKDVAKHVEKLGKWMPTEVVRAIKDAANDGIDLACNCFAVYNLWVEVPQASTDSVKASLAQQVVDKLGNNQVCACNALFIPQSCLSFLHQSNAMSLRQAGNVLRSIC